MEERMKENYAKNLKASGYVATYDTFVKDDPEFLRFPLAVMYDVLRSGRFQGSRLLELGSGALVHNIASASAHFPDIVMGDYVEDNCEELKRWLRGQSPIKQFLHVPAQLEGFKENLEHGKQLIESRIRKAVKAVVRCDVLNDNIFLEELKPEVAPPYDLVVSSLCLECAVPDLEGYVLALKRINKLLRPGGGLILVGFLGSKSWSVDDTEYPYIDVTESDVLKALSEGGFGNIDLKTHDKFDFVYEHDKYYCLAAEKL